MIGLCGKANSANCLCGNCNYAGFIKIYCTDSFVKVKRPFINSWRIIEYLMRDSISLNTKDGEAATRAVLQNKLFLCTFNQAYNFINKETLVQVFSCEFCKISKNTFFTKHLWTSASEQRLRLAVSSFQLCLWLPFWKSVRHMSFPNLRYGSIVHGFT